ncbi:MAG: hypothetical protein Q8P79_02320 [Nanoarchaeota archaeon]|nr:hypothetical protein [Nanoarchaeota archaeon]
MAGLNQLRLETAEFLNIKIIDTGFFFLNLWHIVHFISGGVVMFFIMNFFKEWKIKKKFLVLFGLLVLYEMFEISFMLSGSSLFRGETANDVFFDLLLGMLGGFLFFRFSSNSHSK